MQSFWFDPFIALLVLSCHKFERQASERIPNLQQQGYTYKLLTARVLSCQSSPGPCPSSLQNPVLSKKKHKASGARDLCEPSSSFDEGVSNITLLRICCTSLIWNEPKGTCATVHSLSLHGTSSASLWKFHFLAYMMHQDWSSWVHKLTAHPIQYCCKRQH